MGLLKCIMSCELCCFCRQLRLDLIFKIFSNLSNSMMLFYDSVIRRGAPNGLPASDLALQNTSQYFLRGMYKWGKREGEKLQNYNYSTDKETYKINEQSPCSDKST